MQDTAPYWRRLGHASDMSGGALPPIYADDPILIWGKTLSVVGLVIFAGTLWAAEQTIAAISLMPLLGLLLLDLALKQVRKPSRFLRVMILLSLGGAHLVLAWFWTPAILLMGFPILVAFFLVTRPSQANLYAVILVVSGAGLPILGKAPDFLPYFFAALIGLWLCLIAMARTIEKMRQSNWQQSITDPLTGAFNRRFLDQYVQDNTPSGRAAMMLLDMDNFKSLNDQHGHAAGDRALARLARLIRINWASEVVCFRLGGDEFVLMMQLTMRSREGMTKHEEDRHLARLGHSVVKSLNSDGSFSVSGGMTRFCWPCDFEQVYRRADAALYRAKDLGGRQLSLDDSLNGLSQPVPPAAFSQNTPPDLVQTNN